MCVAILHCQGYFQDGRIAPIKKNALLQNIIDLEDLNGKENKS